VLTVFLVLLIIVLLVQMPFVQDFARGKAEHYLSRKLRTRVRIDHLNIAFFNSVTLKGVYLEDRRQDTLLSAGLIDVHLRMLGLLHNRLDIDGITLRDLTAKVQRDRNDSVFNYQFIVDAFAPKAYARPDTAAGKPMAIRLGHLDLDRIRLVYRDTVSRNNFVAFIGHERTTVDSLDLSRLRFIIRDLDLGNTVLTYQNSAGAFYTAFDLRQLTVSGLDIDLARLRFKSRQLRLDSADFVVDDSKVPRQRKGMDYSHLRISSLSVHGEDLVYCTDSASGRITKGELAEQSGFRLNQLQTRFFYSNRLLALSDLYLRTPGSLLRRHVSLQCDSLAGMLKTPAHTLVSLDLPNSLVQVKDILIFAPQLARQPLFRNPDEVWKLSARATGSFDALDVQGLQFGGIGDLRLDLAGKIRHPFDTRRIAGDIDLRNFSGGRATLVSLLPPGTLPSSITVPTHYDLHGRLTGSLDGMAADLTLHTSSGTLLVKGIARNYRSTTAASYAITVRTKALDLGMILQDSAQWGAITSDFTVRGTGLDIHQAKTNFTGRIEAATFRHYRYHDLTIDGAVADQQATLHSAIDNLAVSFQLEASADLSHKFPALKLDWQVDTLDLHAVGLSRDTLQFKGHLAAEFEDTNPDSLQGSLRVTNMDLLRGREHLITDSLIFLAAREDDREHIQLHSEMADLDLDGHYLLTQVPAALEHTISQYYRLEGFRDTVFSPEDWRLRMQLRTSPLLLALMPSLRGTDTLGGVIAYNSDRADLQLGIRTPRIVVGTQFFHNVAITAGTGNGQMQYSIAISDAHGSGLVLYKTLLAGALKDDTLTTALLLKDGKGKDRYRLGGQLERLSGDLKFHFDPDSLLLNYDHWRVSRDNFIQYDSGDIVVHDLTISNDMDSLSLNSRGTTGAHPAGVPGIAGGGPLDIRFGHFRLSTISRLANQDTVIADGVLNGTVQVRNLTSNPVFTSDLKVENVSYKADTLGDLSLKVNNEKGNAFAAEIGLQGKNNDVAITGDYYTGEDKMDLKLDLRRINLATFSGTVQGAIDKMRGYLGGKFTITGTINKPNVRGNLYFDSTVITPTISGETLDVSNDRIAFDEDGFNFSEFALKDSAGNKLTLDGNVFTKDYHSFAFDISVNAQNFRLVNAPENSSRQFYGKLNLDAAVNLEGQMDAPKIDGTIRVNKSTNFYYALPADNPEAGDRLGVVRFVDHRTGDTLVDRKALALQAKKTEIKGVDVSLNLLTDTSAMLNVVIDPRSGDELNIRGRSNLVFQMEKSGKMDLTGSYQVNGGYYTVSFEVLKRKFNIDPNSIITWTGDPAKATVNLTASYTALTPSIDLVSNVINDLPSSEQNKFRQKLPFLVTLKMEGDLLKPVITFDITLPTTILTLWPDVDQRLTELRSQQSEMNKQVFALLLLGRFVGEDPLNSQAGGGSTVGNLAFSSASQILTNQMDQVAASLIKEVDIHFDLNNQQDWSTGTEFDYTELDVTVSKSLANDRLRVSVGSSFDVAGSGAPQQAPSNLAGTVDASYKLSKDGRYLLRIYRQNQYEAVVLGQVIETGVGFVFTFNYDKFREIWHRAKGDTIQATKTSNSSTTSPK
jgi:hypothetical protein